MAGPTMFGPWRKSGHSGNESNCVEIALAWRKSSYSGNEANCVEIARGEPEAAIRDSKNPTGPMITVRALDALVTDIKAGRFDR